MPGSAPSSSERFENALDDLYREFDAPVPVVIEGCPCCMETRRTDKLLTTSLKLLSGEDLWRYTTGVFLTVGSEIDFRYLLPRIFELAATDRGSSPGEEIVLGKLRRANWRSWPASNQQALETFVDAWFELAANDDLQGLADGLNGDRTEAVVCGAAISGIPISRWLPRLDSPEMRYVRETIRESCLAGGSSFWSYAPAAFEELREALEARRA